MPRFIGTRCGVNVTIGCSATVFDGCEILKDSIVWVGIHAAYMVLSADAATKHGFRPHAVIFDELLGYAHELFA